MLAFVLWFLGKSFEPSTAAPSYSLDAFPGFYLVFLGLSVALILVFPRLSKYFIKNDLSRNNRLSDGAALLILTFPETIIVLGFTATFLSMTTESGIQHLGAWVALPFYLLAFVSFFGLQELINQARLNSSSMN